MQMTILLIPVNIHSRCTPYTLYRMLLKTFSCIPSDLCFSKRFWGSHCHRETVALLQKSKRALIFCAKQCRSCVNYTCSINKIEGFKKAACLYRTSGEKHRMKVIGGHVTHLILSSYSVWGYWFWWEKRKTIPSSSRWFHLHVFL